MQKTVAERRRRVNAYVFALDDLNGIMAKGRETLVKVEALAQQPAYERLAGRHDVAS